MLRGLKDPERHTVAASDSDFGCVVYLLLDDQRRTAEEMASLLDRLKA